jgi:hypothetical protein
LAIVASKLSECPAPRLEIVSANRVPERGCWRRSRFRKGLRENFPVPAPAAERETVQTKLAVQSVFPFARASRGTVAGLYEALATAPSLELGAEAFVDGNFLVRSREKFADHAFMVAVDDAPSDHQDGMEAFETRRNRRGVGAAARRDCDPLQAAAVTRQFSGSPDVVRCAGKVSCQACRRPSSASSAV